MTSFKVCPLHLLASWLARTDNVRCCTIRREALLDEAEATRKEKSRMQTVASGKLEGKHLTITGRSPIPSRLCQGSRSLE
jgi:hypothetical protein